MNEFNVLFLELLCGISRIKEYSRGHAVYYLLAEE